MNNPILRFLALFLLLIGACIAAERAWGHLISPGLTHCYVLLSMVLVNLVTPHEAVTVHAAVLSSATTLIIEVTRECDGMTSFILIAAAILATPAPVLRKFFGLIASVFLVGICNLARIVALFYAFKHIPQYAEKVHIFLGPLVLMLPPCFSSCIGRGANSMAISELPELPARFALRLALGFIGYYTAFFLLLGTSTYFTTLAALFSAELRLVVPYLRNIRFSRGHIHFGALELQIDQA